MNSDRACLECRVEQWSIYPSIESMANNSSSSRRTSTRRRSERWRSMAGRTRSAAQAQSTRAAQRATHTPSRHHSRSRVPECKRATPTPDSHPSRRHRIDRRARPWWVRSSGRGSVPSSSGPSPCRRIGALVLGQPSRPVRQAIEFRPRLSQRSR